MSNRLVAIEDFVPSLPHGTRQPVLFSLEETPTHYLLSVDLPTIPSADTQICSRQHELVIEGHTNEDTSTQKKTFFKYHYLGSVVHATYRDGILWISLPKQVRTPARYDE